MDAPRTREERRDDLESITSQISQGLDEGRYSAAELQRRLLERTRQAGQSTDHLVREYPWAAVGLGVVLGLMAGLLLPRR